MSATPFRQYLACMPDVGQGTGWTLRQWRKASVEHVRLTELIATNRDGYLNEQVVDRYLKRGHHSHPCVIEHCRAQVMHVQAGRMDGPGRRTTRNPARASSHRN